MADKLVEYDKYCSLCEFKNTNEDDEPCYTCLQEPVNEDSHRPVKFKEK